MEDFWDQAKSYYVGTDDSGGWTRWFTLAREVAKNKGRPSIAIGPDDTVYVAYGDGLGTSISVFLVTSPDGGKTWSVPEQITAPTSAYPIVRVDRSGLVHILYRRMVCNGDPDDEGTVCSFYQEYVEGRPGGPWSSPVRPIGSTPNQIHAGMVCTQLSNGTNRILVFVAIQYDGLYVAYKDGAGEGWTFPLKVGSTPGKSAELIRPIAFHHKGNLFVYVFWVRYAVSGIESSFSTDGGQSWQYQAVTALGADELQITSPAPVYDHVNGKLWCLYVHVIWTPRRGYIGVVGSTPGQGDWFPTVPGPDEVVVLESDNRQAREVVVGWREGARSFPVVWSEHIRPPHGAYDLEIYQAWVIPDLFSELWP